MAGIFLLLSLSFLFHLTIGFIPAIVAIPAN
jgi:hypothetical protein